MKVLRWIAWISMAIAVVIIILAGIALLTCTHIFGVAHVPSYFHAANSFLLIAIALFVVTKHCICDSSECKEEKKEG